MGFVKKGIKKITGAVKKILNPADEARKQAELEAARAAEAARKQAELEAAKQAATAQSGVPLKDATTDVPEGDTLSKQKKKLSGGRKGLTVSRSGGSGINI